MDSVDPDEAGVYEDYVRRVSATMHGAAAHGAQPATVAQVIARAAASRSPRVRYAADRVARASVLGRALLPTPLLRPVVSRATGG
jgi:hypothetical protein